MKAWMDRPDLRLLQVGLSISGWLCLLLILAWATARHQSGGMAAERGVLEGLRPVARFQATQPTPEDQQKSDGNAANTGSPDRGDTAREGYIVDVDLPLLGDRDQAIKQQISRIAEASQGASQRPILVLRFVGQGLSAAGDAPSETKSTSRGSQFERCLSLARFLTSPEAARVRLVAFIPRGLEGHAVLPALACEEMIVATQAEVGNAAADEPLDATIEGSYRDVVARRRTLPEAAVMAMLKADLEVVRVELADGGSQVVSRQQADELQQAGKVIREQTIWPGGGLASFTGAQMRGWRWITRTADSEDELREAFGLSSALRTPSQLPREWLPLKVTLSGELTAARINQIMRSLDSELDEQQVNLLVVYIQPTEVSFDQATRLANFLADKPNEQLYTLGLVTEPIQGPVGLVAAACNEAVLIGKSTVGPSESASVDVSDDGAPRRVLEDLAESTGRALAMLAAVADPDVTVTEYINQNSGRSQVFTEWQKASLPDQEAWLAKRTVADGGPISQDDALKYRLFDGIEDTEELALSRLNIAESPPELKTPWLDSAIQMLLAQGWLPRVLLTIGFFALMAELGNPGIGAGGFLATICFLGFFWIEGLNGNVEWLEVILFIAGLIALAVEIFVVPGFGLFGIGGLLMVLVSVVLASQTFIWPTTSAQLSEIAVNLFWVACLALCGMIGLVFMHKQIERMPLVRWMKLEPGGYEDATELGVRESVVHYEHLWDQEGLTTTRLNPSGKAQFGREIVPVVGSGQLIEAGVPVRVVEVRGSLVIVDELHNA